MIPAVFSTAGGYGFSRTQVDSVHCKLLFVARVLIRRGVRLQGATVGGRRARSARQLDKRFGDADRTSHRIWYAPLVVIAGSGCHRKTRIGARRRGRQTGRSERQGGSRFI